MDYKKIHDAIIERARTRTVIGYKERHHIIPKCMGGTNNKENLVDLSAREHFIIHKLLCEIYPDNNKLIYAVWMMSNIKYENRTYHVSSKEYERIRHLFRNKHSIQMSGENNPMYGISLIPKNKGVRGVHMRSAETKKKMGDFQKNRKRMPFSAEVKQKMSAARMGYVMLEETKEKLRILSTGRKHTDCTKEKMKKPKRVIQCPHCNKQGGEPQMHQWHYNNCKYAKTK